MEPVTVDQAKQQLRLEGTTADDTLIGDLITAARQQVEAYCGITLVAASETMTFAAFEDLGRLTIAPVRDVTAVRYLDASGTEQVLDAATYALVNASDDPLRPMLQLAFGKTWPSTCQAVDAVRVDADVGYATAPAPVIRAILVLIGQWYDYRAGVQVDARGSPAELPHAVTALLSNFRR